MKGGWVCVHRALQSHWLWEDAELLRAWLDLLMMANFRTRKVRVGSNLVTVGRGQFITSTVKLQERWGWGRGRLYRFLTTLESDRMISRQSDNQKTIITIMNYDIYQKPEQPIGTADGTSGGQRTEQRADTTNKGNKDGTRGEPPARERATPPDQEDDPMQHTMERIKLAGGQFVAADDQQWCQCVVDYGPDEVVRATAEVFAAGQIARAREVRDWLAAHSLTEAERRRQELRVDLERQQAAEASESRRRMEEHRQRAEEAQAEADRLIERVQELGVDPPPDDGPTSVGRILERYRQTGRVAPALLPKLREWVEGIRRTA